MGPGAGGYGVNGVPWGGGELDGAGQVVIPGVVAGVVPSVTS